MPQVASQLPCQYEVHLVNLGLYILRTYVKSEVTIPLGDGLKSFSEKIAPPLNGATPSIDSVLFTYPDRLRILLIKDQKISEKYCEILLRLFDSTEFADYKAKVDKDAKDLQQAQLNAKQAQQQQQQQNSTSLQIHVPTQSHAQKVFNLRLLSSCRNLLAKVTKPDQYLLQTFQNQTSAVPKTLEQISASFCRSILQVTYGFITEITPIYNDLAYLIKIFTMYSDDSDKDIKKALKRDLCHLHSTSNGINGLSAAQIETVCMDFFKQFKASRDYFDALQQSQSRFNLQMTPIVDDLENVKAKADDHFVDHEGTPIEPQRQLEMQQQSAIVAPLVEIAKETGQKSSDLALACNTVTGNVEYTLRSAKKDGLQDSLSTVALAFNRGDCYIKGKARELLITAREFILMRAEEDLQGFTFSKGEMSRILFNNSAVLVRNDFSIDTVFIITPFNLISSNTRVGQELNGYYQDQNVSTSLNSIPQYDHNVLTTLNSSSEETLSSIPDIFWTYVPLETLPTHTNVIYPKGALPAHCPDDKKSVMFVYKVKTGEGGVNSNKPNLQQFVTRPAKEKNVDDAAASAPSSSRRPSSNRRRSVSRERSGTTSNLLDVHALESLNSDPKAERITIIAQENAQLAFFVRLFVMMSCNTINPSATCVSLVDNHLTTVTKADNDANNNQLLPLIDEISEEEDDTLSLCQPIIPKTSLSVSITTPISNPQLANINTPIGGSQAPAPKAKAKKAKRIKDQSAADDINTDESGACAQQ